MGLQAVEREVDRTELYVADEVLFCGSAWEVTPITSVDRYPVGDGTIGPQSPGGLRSSEPPDGIGAIRVIAETGGPLYPAPSYGGGGRPKGPDAVRRCSEAGLTRHGGVESGARRQKMQRPVHVQLLTGQHRFDSLPPECSGARRPWRIVSRIGCAGGKPSLNVHDVTFGRDDRWPWG